MPETDNATLKSIMRFIVRKVLVGECNHILGFKKRFALDSARVRLWLRVLKNSDLSRSIGSVFSKSGHFGSAPFDCGGGNQGMVQATGAKILAHQDAKDQIPDMDIGLQAGDVVKIGKTVELEALDTPGHTMSHICLRSRTDTTAIFCGDTLFNAGAGHCKGGGHPDSLYATFAGQLAKLSDQTLIYPGHDYILNNLNFTLDREPNNERAKTLRLITSQARSLLSMAMLNKAKSLSFLSSCSFVRIGNLHYFSPICVEGKKSCCNCTQESIISTSR
jgi:hypothetical protein